MKKLFKKPLQFVLKILASRILKKFQPDIIAITGSVGKTSTKDAVYEVLKTKFNVCKNKGSYNNEIGIPLTILGLEPSSSFFVWGKNLFLAIFKILFSKKYWDILILEMGADHPGDISYLTSFIKPKIAIITCIAPAHLEFFGSLENIAQEKGKLVEVLSKDDWAVLNADDDRVVAMRKGISSQVSGEAAQVLFYGTDKNADVRADNTVVKLGQIDFELYYRGDKVLIHLHSLGRHHIYAALAAASCGIIYDMDLATIAKSLENFRPPWGRVNLLRGIKNSIIINDVYNSNPSSVQAALQALQDIKQEFPQRRRVVILGDMLELGEKSEELHRAIGKELIKTADLVFLIGKQSRNTFEEIRNDFLGKCFWFKEVKEGLNGIRNNIRENDIILIKGSRGMRMEKAVEELRE